jgi:hypothetical protein
VFSAQTSSNRSSMALRSVTPTNWAPLRTPACGPARRRERFLKGPGPVSGNSKPFRDAWFHGPDRSGIGIFVCPIAGLAVAAVNITISQAKGNPAERSHRPPIRVCLPRRPNGFAYSMPRPAGGARTKRFCPAASGSQNGKTTSSGPTEARRAEGAARQSKRERIVPYVAAVDISAPCHVARVASNRNHARRSASSIHVSSRLALATSS